MSPQKNHIDEGYSKQRKLLFILFVFIGILEIIGAITLSRDIITRNEFLLGNFAGAASVLILLVSFLFDFGEPSTKETS